MAIEIGKIAESLFEKIRNRFEDVSLGDEKAKATSSPDQARFFNFDYVSENGDNFGNVTISIIDNDNLKLYFSKNLSEHLTDIQRKEWYDFLKEMRQFARRHIMTFDTRDISRSNLKIKDVHQVAKSDSNFKLGDVEGNITESRMYGTPKHSFENVGSARIRIVHTESVNPEVRGSRARHINAIYVENAQGERFKLESNKLAGARAIARHISEGGNPYDEVGQHINGMLKEMSELGTFVRGMRRRTFEDGVATKMLEAAINHYGTMHRQLNNLKGIKAYKSFVENFQPQKEQLDEVDLNSIREHFVKKIFDDRMNAALPHVYKAYRLQEEYKQDQIDTIYSILEGQAELTLATNEGMDEYMQMLRFGDTGRLVKAVLEDIATRAVTMPEVADFASHWANNYDMIAEDGDQELKEQKALAVQLVTHYIQDLRKVNENKRLRVEGSELSLDRGLNLLDEGAWAVPDNPQDLDALKSILGKPIPFGIDNTNVTSEIYNVLGNDDLFDTLDEVGNAEGEEADARPTILHWLQDNMPGVYDALGIELQQQQEPAGAPSPKMDEPPAPPEMPPVPDVQPTGQDMAPQPQTPPLAEELASIRRLAGLR